MGFEWRREDTKEHWKDSEYDDMVSFYELCLVLRLSPEYVDKMSAKEIAAAVQAYQNINEGS